MKKTIVVFAGNECTKEKEAYYYNVAYQTGKLLAQSGFIVATGGGEGLMNQVSKGARDNGGETVGVCLYIPNRIQSKYLSKRYLYYKLNSRQKKLISLADGFIALPGGIGTLYEITAVLALKKKSEIPEKTPCILIDGYYREFQQLIDKIVYNGFASEKLNSLFQMASSPDHAVRLLKKYFYEI